MPSIDKIRYNNTDYDIASSEMYSTTEARIGTWIDGKPLYRKVVNYGSLPNNTVKDVNHNISNVDKIWITDGFAFNSSGYHNMLSLCVPADDSWASWYFNVTPTYIRCVTGSDRTSYSAYVILKYTKTTDTATNS